MASTLKIFYQIFSLNYSTDELRENFSIGCNLALVGSKENVSAMLELMGEPVVNLSNVTSHSQIRCLPLPDRRHPATEDYKNLDAAIIHLGNSVPSLEYLRFCCECFAAKTKLLFLTGSDLAEFSPVEIVSSVFNTDISKPNFVSDTEAKNLAAEVLAKTKREPLEKPLETENISPAWLAVGGAKDVEIQSESEELPSTELELSETNNIDWASRLLATWPESDKEPRLGPNWSSSDPLASYIVSPIDIDMAELVPRFDSTLPAIMVLKANDSGASFYKYICQGLGNFVYVLARDYSLLRDNIVSLMIARAAKDSAAAAAASGLTTSLPFVGAFLGLFAVSGETIYITAKQLRLALLIGAIYGRPIDFFARIGELLPVVGGAWGWRIIAREAIGFIPALGSLAKAAVAWSGTYTVGKLSQHFYRQGEQHISDEYREYIDAEAKHLARQAALDCLKSKP